MAKLLRQLHFCAPLSTGQTYLLVSRFLCSSFLHIRSFYQSLFSILSGIQQLEHNDFLVAEFKDQQLQDNGLHFKKVDLQTSIHHCNLIFHQFMNLIVDILKNLTSLQMTWKLNICSLRYWFIGKWRVPGYAKFSILRIFISLCINIGFLLGLIHISFLFRLNYFL